MSRDFMLYLEDILNSSQKTSRYCKGIVFEDFRSDERTYDAVIRNLEIVGEAAKSIPDAVKERYSDIQWREMAALRNIVAHQYFGVKDEIIWDVISRDCSKVGNYFLRTSKVGLISAQSELFCSHLSILCHSPH